MRKFLGTLVILALLGAGGWYAYTTWLVPPEDKMCGRLAELCGTQGKHAPEQCPQHLRSFRKAAGDKAFQRASACIDSAESCLAAGGCIAGASVHGLGQFLEGLVDGIDPSLKERGKQLVDKIKQTRADDLKKKGQQLLEGLKETVDEVAEEPSSD